MKPTQKEAQYTPTYTPWRIWKERDCDAIGEYRLKIVDSNQFIVAELIASNEKIFPQLEKDAELMVRAVNSHEALKGFINALLDDDVLPCVKEQAGDGGCYHCDALKVIAQAEAQS